MIDPNHKATMKLYFSPASTTSLPIVLFCAEEKIDYEPVVVDLKGGAHREPAFLAINPKGKVPVLVDDDFVLTESSAILKYLADKTGSAAYPKDLRMRARVNERMDWINVDVYRDLGYNLVYPQLFPHHARAPGAAQESVLQWGSQHTARALGTLDGIIGDQAYLCGPALTIADYFAAQIIHVGSLIGLDFARYPNLSRWHATMKALPSWKRVNQVFDGFAAALAGKTFVRLAG